MEKWIHGNVSDKVGYKKDEIVFGLFACYDWQVHNETEHKDNKKDYKIYCGLWSMDENVLLLLERS